MKSAIEFLEKQLAGRIEDEKVLESRIEELQQKIVATRAELDAIGIEINEVTQAIRLLKVAGEG